MQFTSIDGFVRPNGFCQAALGPESRRRFSFHGSHWMFAAYSFIQYMSLYLILNYAGKQ
jgi:hypothetical protein